jgi:hypothetical protein
MAVQELESRDDAIAVGNELMALDKLLHLEGSKSIMDGNEVYQWKE